MAAGSELLLRVEYGFLGGDVTATAVIGAALALRMRGQPLPDAEPLVEAIAQEYLEP